MAVKKAIAATLTPIPNRGSQFVRWTTECDSTNGDECIIFMDSDKTVTAEFMALPLLTVVVHGDGRGIVISADGFIDCSFNCSHYYDKHSDSNKSEVELRFKPEMGSVLYQCSCNDNSDCTKIVMDKDKTCTVTFNRIHNTLTVIKQGLATGKVTSTAGIDCDQTYSEQYAQGPEVKLTALDDDTNGARFSQWQGCSSVHKNECVVIVDSDKTVTASFLKSNSMRVKKGIVSDKKRGLDSDKIILNLTECTELENAVADLARSSVHITIKYNKS